MAIVNQAVEDFGFAIQFASMGLRDNKTLALKAIKTSGYVVKYLSDRLKNDKDIAEASVKKILIHSCT